MQPLIKEGRDYIYIQKPSGERLRKYDVVLFRRPWIEGRGKYVLHRILKVNTDGTYWIAGDNCTDGERVREENILGIMTIVQRKGKTVRVSDMGYKLYTYLWCAPWPVRFFILRCKNFCRHVVGKILRTLYLR